MPGSPARPALHPVPEAEPESAPRPESPFDVRDLVAAIGLLLLVAGVAQIYLPAAWIVLGVAALVVAWRS